MKRVQIEHKSRDKWKCPAKYVFYVFIRLYNLFHKAKFVGGHKSIFCISAAFTGCTNCLKKQKRYKDTNSIFIYETEFIHCLKKSVHLLMKSFYKFYLHDKE